MTEGQFSRTALLLGAEAVEKLHHCHVAVFGAGGVGGGCIEALARAGVGEITVIDPDTVQESNLNRQLLATYDTLGMNKAEAAMHRIASIYADCTVHALPVFFLPNDEASEKIDFTRFDYVADCIDTVSGKIALIEKAKQAGVPVISAMGAGNKLDPSRFEVADVSKTSVCPLAKIMRKELKDRGITGVKAVYSKEEVQRREKEADADSKARPTVGSAPFVPPVAGFIMAGEIIKDLVHE
ncbi:MAG: tRNA threonylcarbamoyladenosine dehydratase [Lachnospiraceae bacterium]|nr:tRNA threonylcarbamoyladenosine dehydratase [Lachnospiraceae bacterium]